MTDILKGLVGGSGGTFVAAWVFPSAIALVLLYLFDGHKLGIEAFVGRFGPAEQALALAIAASGVGLVMNALSTPMYRVLEGYKFPDSIQQRLRDRERRRRDAIRARTETARGLALSLLQERLQRFPADDGQTAPTRLGNALRAFETYGVDRYRLDSQWFWSDLVAVVPESLRKELDLARSSVDFFVAATFLSAIVGVAVTGLAFVGQPGIDPLALVVGVATMALTRAWYLSAVNSTSYWDATVRALVNLGRAPLAASMNLVLPATIEQERRMWALAVRFAYYGFDEGSAVLLDEFRVAAAAPPGEARTAEPDRPD